MNPITTKAAVSLVSELRELADFIERHGPAVYLGGGLAIDIQDDFSRHVTFDGAAIRNQPVARTLQLNADMQLRLHPAPEAPALGLKKRRATDGAIVRWDGKPQRAPKRGEYYMYPDDEGRQVFRAANDHKKPKWIME